MTTSTRTNIWKDAMNGIMQCDLMTAKDLSLALCISEDHIRRMVSQRTIPFVKIGRMVRFSPCDIEKWLSTKRVYTKKEINEQATTYVATQGKSRKAVRPAR